MMETLHQIVTEINALPEYVGKGLMELFVLVVGGLMVAWITSTYFAQRSAVAEVRGDIMKKKLDIFEKLVAKLDAMENMTVLSHDIVDMAVKDIERNGIHLKYVPQYPVAEVFLSGDKLKEMVLDVDRYISVNRIYFDKGIYRKLQFFQNYIAIFNRFIVVYQEHFVADGIPLDNPEVKKFENLLTIELGLVLQYELSEEIEDVLEAIRESISNIKYRVHSKPDHSEKRFEEDGEIMQQLFNKKIFVERERIKNLITEQTARGMAAVRC